jgi:hypothetical protein
MFELKPISVPYLGLQLCRLRFPGVERFSDDLVNEMIPENLHDRAIHRRFRQ